MTDVAGDGCRRRRLLEAGGAVAALLAGCTDSSETEDAEGDDEGSAGTDDATETTAAADTDDGTDRSSDSDEELALREANVTGVEVEPLGDGEYRFSVTLLHDDDGEDGHANWWQVETPAGDRLGRRDLAHAHGTREFTRSGTVAVPGEVACVAVRGHDRVHAYGGQAALVTVETGSSRTVRQGSDPEEFAGADCPE